jgi:4-hydroxy-3-methylbut-2-enyl diphosphate reductase
VKSAADVHALSIAPGAKVAYVSQTTLAIEGAREAIGAIKARFPDVSSPPLKSVCLATSERQEAARRLVYEHNLEHFAVVGSASSANTKSLAEAARAAGCANVYIVNSADEIKPGMFAGAAKLGITAGASTPQELIDEVAAKIRALP